MKTLQELPAHVWHEIKTNVKNSFAAKVSAVEQQGIPRSKAIMLARRKFPELFNQSERMSWEPGRYNLSFPAGLTKLRSPVSGFSFRGL